MISVVMPTYREDPEVLHEAIKSVLNQTYRDFEFIIVLDDPQNEELKNVVNSFDDSRIKFFINEKNMRIPATLNKAVALSKGEYIAHIDADDICIPTRLEHQLKYLQEGNWDFIGGITQIIDENGENIYSIKHIPENDKNIKKALKYGQCLAHSTWLFKREVFDRINGYRNIELCEDYDFTLRAALKGFQISNLNEVVVQYRMTKDSVSRTNLYDQYLFLNYLSTEYKKGKIADVELARAYVKKNTNDKKARKYARSNVLFNKMLNELEEHQWSQFIPHGFQLVFSSSAYLNKIYKLARLSAIK